MHNKILVGTWAVACSSMSMFTLLPAIKTENTNMMYVLFSVTTICVSHMRLGQLLVWVCFNAVVVR